MLINTLKRRTILYSILWLIGLGLTYYWATNSTKTLEVIALNQDIEAYTTIEPEWVVTKNIPINLFNESMVKDREEVVGRYSIWPMFKGELINSGRLAETSDYYVSDSDHVIIRVPIQTEHVPAHLLQPGKEIGLIQVSTQRFGEQIESRILLPRVRLIGVHRTKDQVDGIDLSVTELQAAEIAMALHAGKIFIVSRDGPGTSELRERNIYHTFQRLP